MSNRVDILLFPDRLPHVTRSDRRRMADFLYYNIAGAEKTFTLSRSIPRGISREREKDRGGPEQVYVERRMTNLQGDPIQKWN